MQNQTASLRQEGCQRLWFAGAGELARVLYCYLMDVQCAQGTQIPVAGFLDNHLANNPQETLQYLDEKAACLPVLPFTDFVPSAGDLFICALARPAYKRTLLDSLLARGARFLSLVHPTAIVQYNVGMGQGCVLYPGVNVLNGSGLDAFCTLMSKVDCGHNVTVGMYSTLFAKTTLLGNVTACAGVSVYTGATVLPNVTLGEDSTVSAHSVVTQNVPAKAMASGNPARMFLMSESIKNKHLQLP